MARLMWLTLLCSVSVVRAFGGDIMFRDEDIEEVVKRRLISTQFSPQEQECFKEEKVLYEPDQKCYPLLSTGPCSCKAGTKKKSPWCQEGVDSWLVLEKLSNDSLRAVCRPCPCCNRTLYIYMAVDKQCHNRVKEGSRFCPLQGTELHPNEFGEGECGCIRSPPHAELLGDSSGVCHQLYHRGPCRPGETLVPHRDPRTLLPVGRCARNPCADKGEGFAPWESGDGKCYKLGTQGPCDSQSKFNVQRTSRIPGCIQPTNAIITPKTFTSGSPPPVNLPTVGRDFALDLLSTKRKRRAGGKD